MCPACPALIRLSVEPSLITIAMEFLDGLTLKQ